MVNYSDRQMNLHNFTTAVLVVSLFLALPSFAQRQPNWDNVQVMDPPGFPAIEMKTEAYLERLYRALSPEHSNEK